MPTQNATPSQFAVEFFVGPKRGMWARARQRWSDHGVAEQETDAQIINERRAQLTPILRRIVAVS